jgi:hypothetical protein
MARSPSGSGSSEQAVAELIITVSAEGELVVRSEGLSRAQWELATAELRAVLGEPTRQAIEAEQHVHHIHVQASGQVRRGGA